MVVKVSLSRTPFCSGQPIAQRLLGYVKKVHSNDFPFMLLSLGGFWFPNCGQPTPVADPGGATGAPPLGPPPMGPILSFLMKSASVRGWRPQRGRCHSQWEILDPPLHSTRKGVCVQIYFCLIRYYSIQKSFQILNQQEKATGNVETTNAVKSDENDGQNELKKQKVEVLFSKLNSYINHN